MKTRFLYLLLLITAYGFSQSVNNYKGVIVPLKYDFLKEENQYRLTTLSKFNLQKAGFTVFYNNETIPNEYSDRCSLLNVDVKKESAFLMTKLFIIFKDCYGKVVFQSAIGKSREKDFQMAYNEALNEAFKSVYALNYKYNEAVKPNTTEVVAPVAVPAVAVVVENKDLNMLYAQPTASGFQLVDSTPKVVMKVFRTSNAGCFIALKDNIQGVLILKDGRWFFEYYEKETLMSEKIAVKF